jgi:hypothetical protein
MRAPLGFSKKPLFLGIFRPKKGPFWDPLKSWVLEHPDFLGKCPKNPLKRVNFG